MSYADGLLVDLEAALAWAYAAVDEASLERARAARRQAAEVLARFDRLRRGAFTLGQASRIVTLVEQLRALVALIDRRAAAVPAVASR